MLWTLSFLQIVILSPVSVTLLVYVCWLCHKMSKGDYVGRVSQIDAFDFDTEILEQVWTHRMFRRLKKFSRNQTLQTKFCASWHTWAWNQLTSRKLDDSARRLLAPDSWVHRLLPEVKLFLKAGFYTVSLSRRNATFGQDVHGIVFKVNSEVSTSFD